MSLVAIIKQEVFEALSDELKAEYKKQDDGTYILDVTPVGDFALENTKGLKSTIAATRKERDDAIASLKVFEGLDADQARSAIKKLEELGDLDNLPTDEKVKQQIQSIKDQYAAKETGLVQKHKQEMSAKEEAIASLNDVIIADKRDRVIKDALLTHKGAAFLADTIEKMVKVEVVDGKTTVKVFDKDGNPRISPATGSTDPMTIEELVVEMKTSDIYAGAFEGTDASGTGAGSGKAVDMGGVKSNPWKKETVNVTEQFRIKKENPTLAKQLMAQAGAA